MLQISQKPLLASVTAVFFGLILSLSVSVAEAQSLPDIQRLVKQNQMPRALEKVDVYISSNPKDAQGRFLKGLILTELNRQGEAIDVFTKLTGDFPELPEPYNNLAVLYAQQKQYDKARTALEMAIRTHPSYAIAHENLGDVYAKLASQAYDKALKLDSSNTSTQTKLSLIKDLITGAAKPGNDTAPVAAASPPSEPVKIAAAEPTKAVMPKPAVAEKPAPAAQADKPVEKQEAPVAAEKTVEQKPVADNKPAVAAGNDEADVKKALLGWASAWSNKDVKAYLSYYAGDFQTPKGRPRKVWEKERYQRIDKPGKLQVTVEDVRITINDNKATATFYQSYSSATFQSATDKTLVFVKSGNKWLIQQERVI